MSDPTTHAAAVAAAAPPAVRVYVLGRFRVLVGDHPVPDGAWRRRKARQLFKCLLSRHGRRLTKDEAVELLWPESDPEAALTNLRSTVFALRRALMTSGNDSGSPGELVVVDRDTVRLRAGPEIWVDADAFETALARAAGAANPSPLLEEADTLYAGDYLPDDLYEDWATERREALKRAWTHLQLVLARARERRGDPDGAVAALQRLSAADPCDERAARELMQLLARQGRRSDALRVYQRLERALRDELGVEPADETSALQRGIVAGEIAAPPRHETPTASSAGTSDTAAPAPPPAASYVCGFPFPAPDRLVGREVDLARLERIVQRGRTGGQVVLIGAPAGTGKSTLAGELVRRASAEGVLCLAGGTFYQDVAAPLAAVQEALAGYLLAQPPDRLRADLGSVASDLARVVPELRYHLGLADAPSADARAERPRLFGAVHACLRGLAERGPVVLCLEDLHAADAATLQLVHYLARQARGIPLVLLGTYRSDEAPAGQPLAQLMTALTRERLAESLILPPLDRDDTARLASALLDGPASEGLTRSLYETTEGNPLFVEQLVLALQEEGRVDRREGVWHQTAPSRGVPTIVREVIGQRLDRLSPACRDTLAMAAVLGQTFQHDVLLAVLEQRGEGNLLEDVEEALRAQLLQELPSCYTFGHALVRETVYWAISGPRRMLLHARAGETLEKLAGERAADQAPELARHFTLAGDAPPMRTKAIHYSLEAGRRAAAISAHREALDHFIHACDAIERADDASEPTVRLEALEGRGQAERELAMWPAAIASFRRVLELSDDPLRRARARGVIAYALHHTFDTAAALVESDAGLTELEAAGLGPHAAVDRMHLQYQKALLWFLQGRYTELLNLGNQILRVADDVGAPRPLFWGNSARAWGYMGLGQAEPALEHYELALAAAERADHKVLIAIGHENLGIQNYLAGRFEAAHAHLDRALTLYHDAAGDARAVNTHQYLGRLWLAEGDLRRARAEAELACALATEAQDRWAADSWDVLGAVQMLESEWGAAATSFEQAHRGRAQAGYAEGAVQSLVGLGLVSQRRGDWSHARDTYERAVEVASAMDPGPQAVAARRHLGRLLLRLGDEASAAEQIKLAAALARTMPQTLEYGPTFLALAELRWRTGDTTSAQNYAERSLTTGRTVDSVLETNTMLVLFRLSAGRSGEARRHADAALGLAERVGAPYLLGRAHLAAGLVRAADGDLDSAAASFEAGLRHFDRAGTPYERALVLRDYAQALSSRPGQLERVKAMLGEALEVFRALGARPAARRLQATLSSLEAPREQT